VPEADAWLDALQQEDPPWKNADEARQAFPLTVTEAGRARLARAVKGAVRKRDEGKEPGSAAPTSGAQSDRAQAPVPRLRPLSRRPATPEEAERAAREARRVVYVCLGILAFGLVAEVF
jgi:hypothetical protein